MYIETDGMKLTLKAQKYPDRLVIMANEDNGMPYGRITVFITELPENYATIDTNNWPELPDIIEKYKLGKFMNQMVPSGYCEYPVYEFDMNRIKQFENGDD